MELSERYLKQLEDEGFAHVYEWFGEPGDVLPVSATEAALLVSEGTLARKDATDAEVFGVGMRITLAPGSDDTYVAGAHGCKAVIGEN